MKTLPTVVLACVAVSLCACASLPKATITYYPARTSMSVSVLRTMKCSPKNELVESLAVTPNVVQAADTTQPRYLQVDRLARFLSDTDLTVTLYDDGRLKSVNGGSTGQGEAALTTAFTLIGAALFAFDGSSDKLICDQIAKIDPDGKGITLTYGGDVNLDSGTENPVPVLPESGTYEGSFIDAIGAITATAGQSQCASRNKQLAPAAPGHADPPVQYADAKYETQFKAGDRLALQLRDPALTRVTVCSERTKRLIWTAVVPVAQHGKDYKIYFPKPATFGSTLLAVNLAESGALTSIQYKRGDGTGSALSVIETGANAKEDAMKAGTDKDKAWLDRQATNQKMVDCKLDKTKC